MDKLEVLQQYLTPQGSQVSMAAFCINILLAGLLAWILAMVYRRYGSSLSNRAHFGYNFVVLAMTTMLIISIVKSSLALSLGLVGALSIVRFRAAIKEPEELTYLFLCIAIGLGMGAGQVTVTIFGFVVIMIAIAVRRRSLKDATPQNLYFTIATDRSDVSLQEMVDTLSKNCSQLSLKRFDESDSSLEASFHVEFSDLADLEKCRAELREKDSSLTLSFLDVFTA